MIIVPEKAEKLKPEEIERMKPLSFQQKALEDIYKSLHKGENIIVCGSEGSGKTFLALTLKNKEEIPVLNGRYLSKEDKKIIERNGVAIIDDASRSDISMLSSLESQIIFFTETSWCFPDYKFVLLENMDYVDIRIFLNNYSVLSDPFGRCVAGIFAILPGDLGRVVNYFDEITQKNLEKYGIKENENFYMYSQEFWKEEIENKKKMRDSFKWFCGKQKYCRKHQELSFAPLPENKIVGMERALYFETYNEIFNIQPSISYRASSRTGYR